MPDFTPRMPVIDDVPDIAERFAAARDAVTGGIEALPGHDADQRYVILLTPGRMLMEQPCPKPGTIPPELVAGIEQIAPTEPPLNISAIALTEIQAVLTNVAQTIPFFGYLLGLCYMGHNVIVFEGHPSALAAGVADADLVIVDGGMVPFMQSDWAEVILDRPEPPRILVFGRDGSIEQIVKDSAELS